MNITKLLNKVYFAPRLKEISFGLAEVSFFLACVVMGDYSV